MMIKKTTMMIMAHLLVMGSDQPLSVLYCCRQYKQNEWPHRRSLGFSKTSKQMEQRIISFIDLSNNNDDKKNHNDDNGTLTCNDALMIIMVVESDGFSSTRLVVVFYLPRYKSETIKMSGIFNSF